MVAIGQMGYASGLLSNTTSENTTILAPSGTEQYIILSIMGYLENPFTTGSTICSITINDSVSGADVNISGYQTNIPYLTTYNVNQIMKLYLDSNASLVLNVNNGNGAVYVTYLRIA